MTPRPHARVHTARRTGTALLAVALLAAGAVGLVAFFATRDTAPISSAAGPGREFADLGATHLRPGERARIRYNSSPPTSGPHIPLPVRRDAAVLSNDQILQALELGDVVLVYGSAQPPAAIVQLARQTAGPFVPALAAAGQAVILARRPGTRGVAALAWRHLLRSPDGSGLRQFVEYWLGRGKPA